MTELQKSLNRCRVEGCIVYLPLMSEGPLENYPEVKRALEKAGGKYKRNTFVFPDPAQPYMDRLLGGEKVNVQKEFQFYATPSDIADRLVKYAEIHEGDCVLEPSAGQGAIIEAIYRAFPRIMDGPNDKPCVTVDYYELMEVNRKVLYDLGRSKGFNWTSRTSDMGKDFLMDSLDFENSKPVCLYDRIVANPPFSNNQDIEHIYRMYQCLKRGGRIVTIASKHWQISKNGKEKEFRTWLDGKLSGSYDLEPGTFKASGTQVDACILIIDK